MNAFKRRKLNSRIGELQSEETVKAGNYVNLPQKKRAILGVGVQAQVQASRSSSPSNANKYCSNKKLQAIKSNATCNAIAEDATDDETLIREAEVALKNLSGSWPTSRNAFYNNDMANNADFEPPAFENLFEEKQQVR